jgi:RNA polymerase sigma-70 factor (ECF subfamily)
MADGEPLLSAVPATGDADDRTLAARARTDPDAFAELYRRHVGAIHAFAWRRSGSRQLAEDVTSATFERALGSIDRFEWQGGGFVAWLHRIAANELAGHHRREARIDAPRAQAALLSLVPDDAPTTDPMADWPRVRAALDHLRPRYQEVIALRYLAGMSADDAAAALGTTKPVLAVTLHRALRALAREVAR